MLHSYPWYTADWRGSEAVAQMSLEEKGMYREMLDRCWEVGSLPVEESLLRRLCGASAWEWKRSWPRVSKQFFEREGRLHHLKVDEKRPDLETWHNGRKEAGRKGAEKRWGSSAIAQLSEPSKPSSSTSSTSSIKTNTCASDDARVDEFRLAPVESITKNGNGCLNPQQRVWFDQWWPIYWHKKSRKDAERAFHKNVNSESRFAQVMSATQAQTAEMMGREPDKRPYPATWLNGGRWEDEEPMPQITKEKVLSTFRETPPKPTAADWQYMAEHDSDPKAREYARQQLEAS